MFLTYLHDYETQYKLQSQEKKHLKNNKQENESSGLIIPSNLVEIYFLRDLRDLTAYVRYLFMWKTCLTGWNQTLARGPWEYTLTCGP
jgi:hypothetical protein